MDSGNDRSEGVREDILTSANAGCSEECRETVRDLKWQIRELQAENKGLRASDESKKNEIARLNAQVVHLQCTSNDAVGKEAATKLKNIGNAILKIAGGEEKGISLTLCQFRL